MALDREPVFATTYEVRFEIALDPSLCRSCGSVVWDEGAHIQHHRDLFDALDPDAKSLKTEQRRLRGD